MASTHKLIFVLALLSFIAGAAWWPAYLLTGFCLGWLIGPILLDMHE